MRNRDRDYWRKKFEELEKGLHEKGVNYYRLLEKDYQEAARDTINEILKLYSLLVSGEGISLSEAKKILSDAELEDFRESLDFYIAFGEENGLSQAWMTELERLSLSRRITRLQAMKVHIQAHANMLYCNELNDAYDLMYETYEESYNKTAFLLSVGLGLLVDFKKLDFVKINKVISTPWTADGINFSERIWGKHRTALINDLEKGLTQMIIRGESPDKLIKFITKKYNVSKAVAGRLVLTESARVASEGQVDMFKQSGVKRVQFIATLDERTSEICRYMDGKIFDVKDLQIGVNQPPLHPNCRSVLSPYFEDMKIKERAARDENGKTIYVDGNMTYDEWHKKYVEKQ